MGWGAYNNIHHITKSHYFEGNESACGHAFYASTFGDEWTTKPQPRCKHCIKLIPKIIARELKQTKDKS